MKQERNKTKTEVRRYYFACRAGRAEPNPHIRGFTKKCPIHPSVLHRLSRVGLRRQQPEEGSPDRPLPGHTDPPVDLPLHFPLIWHLEVLPLLHWGQDLLPDPEEAQKMFDGQLT